MNTRNQATKKPELPALTGIRFFAAAYVVFYHFAAPNIHGLSWPLQDFLSVGYTAVGFFFLLSGFVLAYSYADKAVDRAHFWRARFNRIYPAYLFAFLLASPFQIWGSLHVNGLRVALEKLSLGAFLSLTLLQAWTPWTAWYWNIPAWSLSVEAFFYFCFPFLIRRMCKLRIQASFLLAVGLWVVSLTGPAVYSWLRPIASQPPFAMSQLAIETNPLLRLPEFLAGILIGRVFISGFRFSAPVAFLLSIGSLVGLIGALMLSAKVPRLLLSNGLVMPLSALLIFALAHQSGLLAQLLSGSLLKVLGESSYAIYVLQYPVSYALGLNNVTFTLTRFVLYLIVLMAASLFTFFFIERPVRRWLSSKKRVKGSMPVSLVDSPVLTQRIVTGA